jgi:SOS-response transcriptional repressor LexA
MLSSDFKARLESGELVKKRLDENAVLDNPSGKTKAKQKAKKTAAPAPKFTPRQGEFLAFIHAYIKMHGVAPSENEICTRFALTPPSVHDAIVRMHKRGLIDRTPGQARSIRVLVPDDEIPPLEDKTTPQAPVRPLSRKQKEAMWRTFMGKG